VPDKAKKTERNAIARSARRLLTVM